MNKLIETICDLGFIQKQENVFELDLPIINFSSNQNLKIFLYKNNNNFYFCDNGDIVESFDCLNININNALKNIEEILNKYNCFLNQSKITKKIEFANFKNDLSDLLYAIIEVELMYKNGGVMVYVNGNALTKADGNPVLHAIKTKSQFHSSISSLGL